MPREHWTPHASPCRSWHPAVARVTGPRPVGTKHQWGADAVPGTDVGEERGQPSHGIQRPLGQGAAECDSVVRSVRPLVKGSGPQDQVIAIGQRERVAGEDVLVYFLDPLCDRGAAARTDGSGPPSRVTRA